MKYSQVFKFREKYVKYSKFLTRKKCVKYSKVFNFKKKFVKYSKVFNFREKYVKYMYSKIFNFRKKCAKYFKVQKEYYTIYILCSPRNIPKFQTLYAIPFGLNLIFLCICFIKYNVVRHTV